MDDTAFFYSRALRIIVALAIVIPLVGIGGLLWYFASDVPEDVPQEQTQAAANAEAYEAEPALDEEEDEEVESTTNDSPLKPIGPPASTRPTSGGCSSCA